LNTLTIQSINSSKQGTSHQKEELMILWILQLLALFCVIAALSFYFAKQLFNEKEDPYDRFTKVILSGVGLAVSLVMAIAFISR
jgi:magnesium-transporting ATPase (P-type)